MDKEPWEKVKEELITVKGITEEQTEKLKTFVVLKDKPQLLQEKLVAMKELMDNEKGKKALDEMAILIEYLKIMDVEKYCTFRCSILYYN